LAQFELGVEDENCESRARKVFEKANDQLRQNSEKEERLLLLEGWKAFEYTHGNEETRSKVEQRMPKKIKRRRKIETADGVNFF